MFDWGMPLFLEENWVELHVKGQKNSGKCTFLKKNEKKLGKYLVESENVRTFATAYEK